MSLLEFDACEIALGGRIVVQAAFSIAAGERVALIGANGAGKTTLLRAALGFVTPQAGRVRLGGADAHTMSPLNRAHIAAYLPQRAHAAWPISVRALAALGRFSYGAGREDGAAIDAALEAADMTRFAARRLDTLSGGEQARAHLARALAQAAPLLLLDEPSANLDPAQGARLADVLAGASSALMFATHDLPLVNRLATRVLILAEGRIIADGPPRAALTSETLACAFGRGARLAESEAGPCIAFS